MADTLVARLTGQDLRKMSGSRSGSSFPSTR